MNKIYCNSYRQNTQMFISTVMNINDIIRISKALIYGKDDCGYQRALNKKHVNNIAKSIKNNEGLISPTSIVLGIDIEDLIRIVGKDIENNIFELDIDKVQEPIFRIIDGQHRIEGFKEALSSSEGDKLNRLNKYKLNVIIMVIENKNKIEEVKVFRDINSKAKPLKVDLAILALYEFERKIKTSKSNFELSQYFSIKVAYKLNENEVKVTDKVNVWQNGIILDPNADKKTAIIGFKTFCESIEKMCKLIIEKYNITTEIEDRELNEYVDNLVNCIIVPCWNTVFKRWNECFDSKIIKADSGNINIYHDKQYYIQKTIGAKSINLLITDILQKTELNYGKTVEDFYKCIENSKLTYEDWISGGRFLGLSSEAGIKKVKELIKNH
ncbi:DGQHR domain-containing protein [Paraclostridium sordellii]|uniref:DGQHR domain-containing protein n=1 Tax=Paraclostridium sordellii TaxID=1505 RepID=UPI0022E41B24|nr:DGQHR domain-containing protein [Paeniclostridium sordellii]